MLEEMTLSTFTLRTLCLLRVPSNRLPFQIRERTTDVGFSKEKGSNEDIASRSGQVRRGVDSKSYTLLAGSDLISKPSLLPALAHPRRLPQGIVFIVFP